MATAVSNKDIHAQIVRAKLRYDPETGLLHWRESRGRMAKGMVAGTAKARGYVQVRINGEFFYAHRLAWVIQTGQPIPDGVEIDHRDGDPSNNRWANLRLATSQQNKQNTRRPTTNTSGSKGVTYRQSRQKWQAQISVDNRCVFLGNFDSFAEAVAARQAAERRYFGEFAAA